MNELPLKVPSKSESQHKRGKMGLVIKGTKFQYKKIWIFFNNKQKFWLKEVVLKDSYKKNPKI